MNVREALIAVRELLTDPKHWTQGFYARDEAGGLMDPKDSRAACWCLLGACRKVADTYDNSERLGIFLSGVQDESIVSFNDHPLTKHEDVLNLLDKTIANA